MSRTGIEAKPPWQTVPAVIREKTREILRSTVVRGTRVWGGYSPTPTFRLTLADGRRAFFKGVDQSCTEFARRAFASEARVYRDLGSLISPWAPTVFGFFEHADWQVLLLEDVGPKTVPPWTASLARTITRAYADFHRSTFDTALPDSLRRSITPFGPGWDQVAEDTDQLRLVAELAGAETATALRWLRDALPALIETSDRRRVIEPPYALLHLDTRSDNLRYVGGRLRIFDWPYASVGPVEKDVVAFAQSVTVEGGPSPEEILTWYTQCLPMRDDAIDATIAGMAGFFAARAWLPEEPGLPRLRSFQRRQLRVCLAWAARRLALPPPTWLDSVAA